MKHLALVLIVFGSCSPAPSTVDGGASGGGLAGTGGGAAGGLAGGELREEASPRQVAAPVEAPRVARAPWMRA